MTNFKTKINQLIHRHPWAAQTALALVIATAAILSTAQIDWAKAFTLPPIIIPDIVVSQPAPKAVWHVGLSQDIQVRYLRDVTTSYNVRVVLCQEHGGGDPNNGAVCLDDEIVDTTNVIVGPATAGTVQKIGTWTKVGYKLDGTIIPGDFTAYHNNTQISLYLTEVGVTPVIGRHVSSGIFSITNVGGYVNQPSLNTHWRLGEKQQIRWGFLGNVIKWGHPNSDGRYGTAAVYLMNDKDANNQRLLVDVVDIHQADIGGTAGMGLDYIVGSTNVRVGYSSSYRYWFEVDVWYDQSDSSKVVTLPGEPFIIDPAGYTIEFSSPSADGSTVWPVDQSQTIVFSVIPKNGITDPFRVDNSVDLYLRKALDSANGLAVIKQGVVIPANSTGSPSISVAWTPTKLIYDQYDLAGIDLRIDAAVGSVFSGEQYHSATFRLRSGIDVANEGVVMHVSGPSANPTYNPDAAPITLNLGETTGSTIWLDAGDLPSTYFPIDHGVLTVTYDSAVVDPVADSVHGNAFAGSEVTNVVDNPGSLVISFQKPTQPPSGIGGFFGFVTIEWQAVAAGSTEINLQWTAAGQTGDGTDIFSATDPAQDLLRRVEPVGLSIAVGANPFSGTYESAPLEVANSNLMPTSFDTLSASFGQPAGSTVKFSIGFFHRETNGTFTNLGQGQLGFDNAGYVLIDMGTGVLPDVTMFPWFNQITDVKIRIEMSTPDIYAAYANQPWVQSVAVNYTANDTTQSIGLINFHDNSTNGQFSANPNETTSVVVDVTASASYTGTVQMELGQITNKTTGLVDTTISGNLTSPASGRLDLTPNSTQSVTIQLTPTDSTATGTYVFSIRGYDVTNSSLKLSPDPKTGDLVVGNGANTEQFVINISEANQTVAKGGTVVYNLSVTRASTYTGTIVLSTDVRDASVYGASVESAIFNPTSITFGPNDVIVPGGPVLTKTAILTLKAAANASILDQDKTFAVTGSDGTNSANDTSILKITANGMVLHVTIPLEAGTKPVDPTKYALVQHPNYTLRIYSGVSRVAEVVGFHTNTANQADITISALQPGTYQVYARTTRHLWKKATTPTAGLVVVAGTTEYTLSWPTDGLPASDYSADNIISALDFPAVGGHINETGDDLLGDVNNDGIISSLDYSFMINLFNNVFKFNMTGDPLPDSNW